jgi:soluble lytic murein transglycosylase-like protein
MIVVVLVFVCGIILSLVKPSIITNWFTAIGDTTNKIQIDSYEKDEESIGSMVSENPSVTVSNNSTSYSTLQSPVLAQYISQYNPKVFPALADLIATNIITVSREFGIPPVFLLALAQVESGFNYSAVSNAQCIGLLQINPTVWVTNKDNKHNLKKAKIAVSVHELFDPLVNLRAGAHIFNIYYMRAMREGKDRPLEYTLTRYFGGTQNNHYDKFEAAVGSFFIHKQALKMTEEDSQIEISITKELPECVSN